MRTWRWYSKLLFAVFLLAFAYWVWPTPYSHTTGYRGVPVRVSRITGSKQEFCQGRWLRFMRPGQMTFNEFMARYYPGLDREFGEIGKDLNEHLSGRGGHSPQEIAALHPTLVGNWKEAQDAWERERRR